MRPAVLAAALTFDERLEWLRLPVRGLARKVGSVAMRWLDRRREQIDEGR